MRKEAIELLRNLLIGFFEFYGQQVLPRLRSTGLEPDIPGSGQQLQRTRSSQ
jgi:hypothetical protein